MKFNNGSFFGDCCGDAGAGPDSGLTDPSFCSHDPPTLSDSQSGKQKNMTHMGKQYHICGPEQVHSSDSCRSGYSTHTAGLGQVCCAGDTCSENLVEPISPGPESSELPSLSAQCRLSYPQWKIF